MASNKRHESEAEKQNKRMEYEARKRQHELVLTKRLEKSLKKKSDEAKELKKTLRQAKEQTQEMIKNDINHKLEYFREHHLSNQFQKTADDCNVSTSSLSSGIIDDASSSIVHVPQDILGRVKSAKRYPSKAFVSVFWYLPVTVVI
jgi:glutathione synthase/RimK-type ligase-like ATP-grasp enzyme